MMARWEQAQIRNWQTQLDTLKEENAFNQAHIERLDRQLTTVQSLCRLYDDRLKHIGRTALATT